MYNTIEGREEKILMKIFKDWDKDYVATFNEMMMVQDLLGFLKEMKRTDVTVVVIINYNGTPEEKIESLKYVTSLFENRDDVVILSWAFASIRDYPESQYYDSSLGDDTEEAKEEIKDGKKPVPYDEAIYDAKKILESAGFINSNDFIGYYEFSETYLYGNKLGNEVIEFAKKMNEKMGV